MERVWIFTIKFLRRIRSGSKVIGYINLYHQIIQLLSCKIRLAVRSMYIITYIYDYLV